MVGTPIYEALCEEIVDGVDPLESFTDEERDETVAADVSDEAVTAHVPEATADASAGQPATEAAAEKPATEAAAGDAAEKPTADAVSVSWSQPGSTGAESSAA